MKQISNLTLYRNLENEERNKLCYCLHGLLFEDGQCPQNIHFDSNAELSKMAESANRILIEWMKADISITASIIPKILQENGDMFDK